MKRQQATLEQITAGMPKITNLVDRQLGVSDAAETKEDAAVPAWWGKRKLIFVNKGLDLSIESSYLSP